MTAQDSRQVSEIPVGYSSETMKFSTIPRSNKQIILIYLVSLITFAILIAASIQHSDGAALNPVGKYKSNRDRGCYYMLQHFKNGDQIKTDEPCLNCTCENSMLMCYLRVCPYVKPVGDRCIIERVQGECCPKITCPDVAPPSDSLEQELESDTVATTTTSTSTTTSSTTTTTTSTPANSFDIALTNASEVQSGAGGCMLNNVYYHEGSQMPSDRSKPCEVCYCIRNSSACVMQDCALEVGGCMPIYQAGGCCPTRYNCSAINAFTTPRPKLASQDSASRRRFWDVYAHNGAASSPTTPAQYIVSSTTPVPMVFPDFGRTPVLPPPGCRAPNSSWVFSDGERVPSKNKCEHCYCMRSEIVCAVQECRPPCEGCVPIIDEKDECCPKRYECAAPTQRVPAINIIDLSDTKSSLDEQNSTNGSLLDGSQSSSSTTPKLGDLTPVTTSYIDTQSVGNENNLTSTPSTPAKPEISIMTTRQTKAPLRPISPKISLNDEDGSNDMIPEQDSSKSTKSELPDMSTPNVDGFNLHGEREQEIDSMKSNSKFVAPEGLQPPVTSGNQALDFINEILPQTSLTSTTPSPLNANDSSSQASADSYNESNSGDRKSRPQVVPSAIPGEGSCRYNGKMYQNGQEVKSKDECMEICMCINSVVYCDDIDCPKGPENQDKCTRIYKEGECCPKYVCKEDERTTKTNSTEVSSSTDVVESSSSATILPAPVTEQATSIKSPVSIESSTPIINESQTMASTSPTTGVQETSTSRTTEISTTDAVTLSEVSSSSPVSSSTDSVMSTTSGQALVETSSSPVKEDATVSSFPGEVSSSAPLEPSTTTPQSFREIASVASATEVVPTTKEASTVSPFTEQASTQESVTSTPAPVTPRINSSVAPDTLNTFSDSPENQSTHSNVVEDSLRAADLPSFDHKSMDTITTVSTTTIAPTLLPNITASPADGFVSEGSASEPSDSKPIDVTTVIPSTNESPTMASSSITTSIQETSTSEISTTDAVTLAEVSSSSPVSLSTESIMTTTSSQALVETSSSPVKEDTTVSSFPGEVSSSAPLDPSTTTPQSFREIAAVASATEVAPTAKEASTVPPSTEQASTQESVISTQATVTRRIYSSVAPDTLNTFSDSPENQASHSNVVEDSLRAADLPNFDHRSTDMYTSTPTTTIAPSLLPNITASPADGFVSEGSASEPSDSKPIDVTIVVPSTNESPTMASSSLTTSIQETSTSEISTTDAVTLAEVSSSSPVSLSTESIMTTTSGQALVEISSSPVKEDTTVSPLSGIVSSSAPLESSTTTPQSIREIASLASATEVVPTTKEASTVSPSTEQASTQESSTTTQAPVALKTSSSAAPDIPKTVSDSLENQSNHSNVVEDSLRAADLSNFDQKSTDMTTSSSTTTIAPSQLPNVTASPADDFVAGVSASESSHSKPIDVTTVTLSTNQSPTMASTLQTIGVQETSASEISTTDAIALAKVSTSSPVSSSTESIMTTTSGQALVETSSSPVKEDTTVRSFPGEVSSSASFKLSTTTPQNFREMASIAGATEVVPTVEKASTVSPSTEQATTQESVTTTQAPVPLRISSSAAPNAPNRVSDSLENQSTHSNDVEDSLGAGGLRNFDLKSMDTTTTTSTTTIAPTLLSNFTASPVNGLLHEVSASKSSDSMPIDVITVIPSTNESPTMASSSITTSIQETSTSRTTEISTTDAVTLAEVSSSSPVSSSTDSVMSTTSSQALVETSSSPVKEDTTVSSFPGEVSSSAPLEPSTTTPQSFREIAAVASATEVAPTAKEASTVPPSTEQASTQESVASTQATVTQRIYSSVAPDTLNTFSDSPENQSTHSNVAEDSLRAADLPSFDHKSMDTTTTVSTTTIAPTLLPNITASPADGFVSEGSASEPSDSKPIDVTTVIPSTNESPTMTSTSQTTSIQETSTSEISTTDAVTLSQVSSSPPVSLSTESIMTTTSGQALVETSSSPVKEDTTVSSFLGEVSSSAPLEPSTTTPQSLREIASLASATEVVPTIKEASTVSPSTEQASTQESVTSIQATSTTSTSRISSSAASDAPNISSDAPEKQSNNLDVVEVSFEAGGLPNFGLKSTDTTTSREIASVEGSTEAVLTEKEASTLSQSTERSSIEESVTSRISSSAAPDTTNTMSEFLVNQSNHSHIVGDSLVPGALPNFDLKSTDMTTSTSTTTIAPSLLPNITASPADGFVSEGSASEPSDSKPIDVTIVVPSTNESPTMASSSLTTSIQETSTSEISTTDAVTLAEVSSSSPVSLSTESIMTTTSGQALVETSSSPVKEDTTVSPLSAIVSSSAPLESSTTTPQSIREISSFAGATEVVPTTKEASTVSPFTEQASTQESVTTTQASVLKISSSNALDTPNTVSDSLENQSTHSNVVEDSLGAGGLPNFDLKLMDMTTSTTTIAPTLLPNATASLVDNFVSEVSASKSSDSKLIDVTTVIPSTNELTTMASTLQTTGNQETSTSSTSEISTTDAVTLAEVSSSSPVSLSTESIMTTTSGQALVETSSSPVKEDTTVSPLSSIVSSSAPLESSTTTSQSIREISSFAGATEVVPTTKEASTVSPFTEQASKQESVTTTQATDTQRIYSSVTPDTLNTFSDSSENQSTHSNVVEDSLRAADLPSFDHKSMDTTTTVSTTTIAPTLLPNITASPADGFVSEGSASEPSDSKPIDVTTVIPSTNESPTMTSTSQTTRIQETSTSEISTTDAVTLSQVSSSPPVSLSTESIMTTTSGQALVETSSSPVKEDTTVSSFLGEVSSSAPLEPSTTTPQSLREIASLASATEVVPTIKEASTVSPSTEQASTQESVTSTPAPVTQRINSSAAPVTLNTMPYSPENQSTNSNVVEDSLIAGTLPNFDLKSTDITTSTSTSTTAPTLLPNVTASPADDFVTGVSASKSSDFKPVDVTTVIPSIRGSAIPITIPWSDISNSSSFEQTTSQSTNVPSAISKASYETKTISHESTQSSVGEPDYEEISEDSGCEYEGKTYNSAQQIPRSHPCDFCFCFRGDIICLQQTCPPPVPHCFETVMDGFCCPRYECPVHTVRSSANSTGLSLTPYDTHSRLQAPHELTRPQPIKGSRVKGCFVDNRLYGVDQVIESASGPCLECRCDRSGMMKCNPKECAPEDPLLQQINREVLQSTLSRSQVR